MKKLLLYKVVLMLVIIGCLPINFSEAMFPSIGGIFCTNKMEKISKKLNKFTNKRAFEFEVVQSKEDKKDMLICRINLEEKGFNWETLFKKFCEAAINLEEEGYVPFVVLEYRGKYKYMENIKQKIELFFEESGGVEFEIFRCDCSGITVKNINLNKVKILECFNYSLPNNVFTFRLSLQFKVV